jgi:hypothetical protein
MIQGEHDPEPHPDIKNSCTSPSGDGAAPAVRLMQWVNAFGEHGLPEDICAASLNQALVDIANRIKITLGPQCVSGTLTDSDPTTPALDPECQVMDIFTDDQQHEHQTALQACAVDAIPPCWSLVDDTQCPAAKRLKVTRAGGSLPDDLHTTISCSLCIPGVARPGCP